MALHGCDQSVEQIGTRFIEYAGYNAVADANDIIILYPQTQSFENNTNGCWDFTGFAETSSLPVYLTKNGVQVKALD